MGVKEDLEKLKGNLRDWTSTKEGYRGVVAVVLFVVGWLAVIRPLSGRLTSAYESQEEVKKYYEMVEVIRHLEEQSAIFADRLTPIDSELTWHNYLMEAINLAEVEMMTVAPMEAEGIGNYRREIFEVRVKGSYDSLVDFLDLIERGSRYMRVDELDLSFSPSDAAIILFCKVSCLSGTTFDQMRAEMLGLGGDALAMGE